MLDIEFVVITANDFAFRGYLQFLRHKIQTMHLAFCIVIHQLSCLFYYAVSFSRLLLRINIIVIHDFISILNFYLSKIRNI